MSFPNIKTFRSKKKVNSGKKANFKKKFKEEKAALFRIISGTEGT